MSTVLKVDGLCKEYPKFKLENISFELQSGSIMGLIGRNGAGKTTTLKSILNLIHTSAGSIRYFDMELKDHEQEIKQRIGYAGGAVDYYKKKKIAVFADITKRFYPNWDEEAYQKYLRLFQIDDSKKPSELSEGMKVKLNLAIALSHKAEILILDEPTSGLDPISRDELLDIFRYLAGQGIAILFSTHITSDLDKCADHITYIRDGRLQTSCSMERFLTEAGEKGMGSTLKEIMIAYEKEARDERFAD